MPAAGRVQLRRNKGWRMPANTVKVDRSTRWGNPFPIGATGPGGRYSADAAQSIAHFRDMLADDGLRAEAGYPGDLTPLAGKHLACWCTTWPPHVILIFLQWARSCSGAAAPSQPAPSGARCRIGKTVGHPRREECPRLS